MSLFRPEFETYQDVRTTLAWWAASLWFALELYAWYGLLDASERTQLLQFSPVADWIKAVGVVSALAVVARLLSELLVQIVRLHEKYDRYVVKWRYNYASRFILPQLLELSEEDLPSGASEVAYANLGEFMEDVFYYFVGDRDTKIRRNLVVRFYEVVTKYWFTQLVEVTSLAVIAVTAVVGVIRQVEAAPIGAGYLWALGVPLAILLLNRVWIAGLRRQLEKATEAEVRDIGRCCSEEFDARLATFLTKHGI